MRSAVKLGSVILYWDEEQEEILCNFSANCSMSHLQPSEEDLPQWHNRDPFI